MTLVIALKRFLSKRECRKNGKAELLVFSDSRETLVEGTDEDLELYGRKVKKVYPILSWEYRSKLNGEREKLPEPLAIWSGAGDSLPLKKGREICERLLKEMFTKEWNKQHPDFGQFEQAVKMIGMELRKDKQMRESGVEMLLGSVDLNGKVSLYNFRNDMMPEPVHSEPGYDILGSGYLKGAHMLINLLGYELNKSWKFKDADVFASFVIDAVSEADPYVGHFEGDGYVMRLESGGIIIRSYEDDYKECTQRAKSRSEIIRSVWELCDAYGSEKQISKKLSEMKQ